jgi:hypothetical protein
LRLQLNIDLRVDPIQKLAKRLITIKNSRCAALERRKSIRQLAASLTRFAKRLQTAKSASSPPSPPEHC